MAKEKVVQVKVEPDLYEAIQQVATDEGKTMSAIVRDLLRDVFIGDRWFKIPVEGIIVDDERLGNKVIFFPGKPEGEAA